MAAITQQDPPETHTSTEERCPVDHAGFGASYDPFVPPTRDNPYPVWAEARRQEPVFYSPKVRAWIVTRYEDICDVVRDPATFANAGAISPLTPTPPEVAEILAEAYPIDKLRPLVATDPPRHTRYRKYANAAFTPQRVAALEPAIREVANGLIDELLADESRQADIIPRFAFRLPLTVVGDVIGVPREDHDHLHRWSDAKTAIQWGLLELDEYKKVAREYVEFQHYCERLSEERRREPRGDVISDMVAMRLEGEEPLTPAELVGQMTGMVSAGHETTMNLIAHAVYHLQVHREQWEALCANPTGPLPAQAVEETLRFDGPVSGMWRTATREARIGDVTVPSGARIQVLYGSGSRDEATYPDRPEEFDILNPDHGKASGVQHLAFGRGAHFCLGAGLARLEGRIALELLATRIPSLRLAVPPESITWRPNAAFRGPATLPVTWDQRI